MNKPDFITALEPLVDCFDEYGVQYYIGGSVASSAHGVARTTIDVDIVADLKIQHIKPLIRQCEDRYYISEEVVEDAIRKKTSFNIIHLETMIKIDVFLLKNDPFNIQAFQRKLTDTLDMHSTRLFFLSSREDIIISKLDWFKKGGEVSERQWGDIIGVLKVQEKQLDFEYLYAWARRLDLYGLLDRALESSNIKESR